MIAFLLLILIMAGVPFLGFTAICCVIAHAVLHTPGKPIWWLR